MLKKHTTAAESCPCSNTQVMDHMYTTNETSLDDWKHRQCADQIPYLFAASLPFSVLLFFSFLIFIFINAIDLKKPT
eukprot:m.115180 g.115180  ORF g.115180 m.115180 type:complete len:77 (-) comp28403_c1_seq1:172-402(-)